MRRTTRTVTVGRVKIGSRHPVCIQSMAKTDTRDVKATVCEIRKLEKAGSEITRVAVPDREAALAIKLIKKRVKIPVVADIHFDCRLALESIKSGADKVRINPGNMRDREGLRKIIKSAKAGRIPIRIGLNSGSVGNLRRPRRSTGSSTCEVDGGYLAEAALKPIKFFEKQGFRDIIISLKSSGVAETISAYRKLAGKCDYPFHLGVTAAGPYDAGIVKSSIGIGTLLADGIGDTVRVSLTSDGVREVAAAKRILQALGLRGFGPDIISCPTCGRCRVDLLKIVKDVEAKLFTIRQSAFSKSGIKLALMGCEVNGPGEAKDADIGIAFGKASGVLFKKGKVIRKVKAGEAVKELLSVITKAR